MAYALAINSIDDYGEPGKIMLSITLIYALITILFVGSMLNPILKWADVTSRKNSRGRLGNKRRKGAVKASKSV